MECVAWEPCQPERRLAVAVQRQRRRRRRRRVGGGVDRAACRMLLLVRLHRADSGDLAAKGGWRGSGNVRPSVVRAPHQAMQMSHSVALKRPRRVQGRCAFSSLV